MKYILNEKEYDIKFTGKVKNLLDILGLSEQIVIVKVNGRIVTELDNIKDSDVVEIQKVIVGG